MSKIEAIDLTFGYNGMVENVFEHMNFILDTSWKTGIIGRNGIGKTTLLKILCGEYEFSGSLEKEIEVYYFPYDVTDVENTVENVMLDIVGNYRFLEEKMEECLQASEEENLTEYAEYLNEYIDKDGYNIRLHIEEQLRFLGVRENILSSEFSCLSAGEKTKILLAALFLKPNTFLVIDEPTNHLDLEGRQILAEYLKKKAGYILVSHDRAFMNHCVDHILSINKKTVSVSVGNYDTWRENFDNQNTFNENKSDTLKKDATHYKNKAEEFRIWSENAGSEKANKKFSARKRNMEHRELLAEEKRKKVIIETEYAPELRINYRKSDYELLLRCHGLHKKVAGRELFSDIFFEVKAGKRLVLRGCNGCGKSTLLKGLVEETHMDGYISKAAELKISYLPQDFDDFNGTMEDFIEEYHLDKTAFFSVLVQLGVNSKDFNNKICELSMGQKKKVYMAKSLCEEASLYIWDEPLNYLDVSCREQIEAVIRKYNIPMILVEHDEEFIKNIGTEILTLH